MVIEMDYQKRAVDEDLKGLKDKPITQFEAADSAKLIDTVIENRELIRDLVKNVYGFDNEEEFKKFIQK